jgi:hypothetical protein
LFSRGADRTKEGVYISVHDRLNEGRNEARAEKIKLNCIDSIQVSHLHVARHGSTFVLNRPVMKLLAQKEATDWRAAQSFSSMYRVGFGRRIFRGWQGAGRAKEGVYIRYMTD